MDNKSKKILVIDDERDIRFFLCSMLEEAGYTVIDAKTGEEALELAQKTPFDVILLDIMLPFIDGHEVCRRLKCISDQTMYIIMLSAKDKAIDKVKGFGAGADDYVTKPFDRQELLARVELGWRTVENLRHAKIDFLTGLVNRRYCIEVLNREMASAIRSGNSLCLAILDLDFFKHINDTHGHMVGDAILIELAKLMKKHLRTSDYMPARLGGDEFALIFSNSNLPDTISVLDRLCSIVASHLFPIVGTGVLSCSIGLTRQKENDSLESFFNRADNALYNAKETGRNRIFVL